MVVNTKILLKEKEIHVKINKDNQKLNLLFLIKEINNESNFVHYTTNNEFDLKNSITTKRDTTVSLLMKREDVYFKAIVGGFKKKDENQLTAIILLGRALSIPTVDVILENINNGILIPVPDFIFKEKHPLNEILRNHKL
jgi:hypothetical protein